MFDRVIFVVCVGLMTGTVFAGDLERSSRTKTSTSQPTPDSGSTHRVAVLQTSNDSKNLPGMTNAPILISEEEIPQASVVRESPNDCDSGSCSGGILFRLCPKLNHPKPPYDPLQCSTFKSTWRFLFGGCRAFFEEGRYKPRYPGNCPCGR